jgi:TolB protein
MLVAVSGVCAWGVHMASAGKSGGNVAFARECAIFVVDTSGKGARRLTRPRRGCDGTPAWSPNGQSIAFVRRYDDPSGRDREFPGEVYVMRPDGSRPRLITTRLVDVDEPRWSPDGTMIVFDERGSGPVVVRADGSGQRPIARNLVYGADPAWSPDGRIAVSQTRGVPLTGAIYTVSSHGGALVRLTPVRPGEHKSPAWSPDGRKVLYTRLVCGPQGFCGAEIWSADTRGRGHRRLARVPGAAANPRTSWSPDATRVLVSGGRPGIWLMRADGTRQHALTASGESPSWSPDGREIVFVRPDHDYGGSRTAIYVMDADGSRRRLLALGGAPSWQPTSRDGS